MKDLVSQLQKAMVPNLAEETVKPLSFKEAGQEVRELQAAWKTIGPVPQAQSQAVWERFRQAADAFYDKRKAFFAEGNVAEVQNLKVKEAIITKLEAQLKEPDFKVVKNLQQQWRECGDGLRDKGRELQKKFRTLCDQIYSAANEGAESSQGEIRI